MKKFTVLAVLALMVAVAMPVVATDLSWKGEFTYGSITDFTNAESAYGNAYYTLVGHIDDFNTINARIAAAFTNVAVVSVLDSSGTAQTVNAFNAYLNKFYLDTDIGKALKLPIGLVTSMGWLDPTFTNYDPSGYGNEGVAGFDPGTRDSAKILVTIAPVNVMLAFSPNSNALPLSTVNPLVLLDVYGAFGPISASAGWYATALGATNGLGKLGLAVAFSQAFGDLTPTVDLEGYYDLTAPAAKALGYGAGVKVAYTTMVSAAVAIDGWDAPGLDALSANVGFVPVKTFGADVGFKMNLATGASDFGLDISAWTLFGVSKLRVGYLYSSTTGADGYGSLNAPTAAGLKNGGLYFTMDVDF
jgi:hypothetical protein